MRLLLPWLTYYTRSKALPLGELPLQCLFRHNMYIYIIVLILFFEKNVAFKFFCTTIYIENKNQKEIKMIDLKEKLIEGFFYDCPDEGCVKELYYKKEEDTYYLAKYLYSKIIDTHNVTITDDEFKSRLLMYPDDVTDYPNGSSGYVAIEQVLGSASAMPDFIGIARHLLYSVASASLCKRSCEHCLHKNQCESVATFDDIDLTAPASECAMFLDVDSVHSEQTLKVLRMYFVNAFSKFSNFDQFVVYCKTCNISRDLLKSLKINYIVFSYTTGRIGCEGHSQIYETKEKAEDYVESLLKNKLAEADKYGYPNTCEIERTGTAVVVKYRTRFGNNESRIQLATLL